MVTCPILLTGIQFMLLILFTAQATQIVGAVEYNDIISADG